ncbi:hypothetical protein [Oscillatoria sp. FACHB-1406]|uniref:hypothetical protein n=1 Tax=Oscillatoria sp. FACHB-1406 TaxID=2692846 RepID=UPI00168242B6|nr:hypothetical protein [Oscillatoria sp. FACHB-1406]MBD2577144.1 hypothetical protein [Oscillatoria sp. FACHB-1406]
MTCPRIRTSVSVKSCNKTLHEAERSDRFLGQLDDSERKEFGTIGKGRGKTCKKLSSSAIALSLQPSSYRTREKGRNHPQKALHARIFSTVASIFSRIYIN